MNQMEQLETNLSKLDKMERLPYNWNGHGGLGFPHVLIHKCKELLKTLPYQPKLAPTGRGTVYIEYEQPNGDKLAFEYGLNKITCAYVPARKKRFGIGQQPKQYDATNSSPEAIRNGIKKFCNCE